MSLSARNRKTLRVLFERPTRANIRWSDIERLFSAAGAEVSEGAGSRVRLHRPHPGNEARRYAVEVASSFLRNHGITP